MCVGSPRPPRCRRRRSRGAQRKRQRRSRRRGVPLRAGVSGYVGVTHHATLNVPAMCFSIQLAFSSTTGFCDAPPPPPPPWSPWARAHPATPAATIILEKRMLFRVSDWTGAVVKASYLLWESRCCLAMGVCAVVVCLCQDPRRRSSGRRQHGPQRPFQVPLPGDDREPGCTIRRHHSATTRRV